MKRSIEIKDAIVKVLDEPGAGGACHMYEIINRPLKDEASKTLCKISFQNGPIKEVGTNGVQHEALITVIIDRLEHFQKGDFRCRENAMAMTKLQEAAMWLNSRTSKRESMGVEGTNKNHE